MRKPPRIRGGAPLALAGLLVFTACSDPAKPDRERIPAVQLLEHELIVSVGDSAELMLLPMLPPGFVPEVDWTSSDPAVVSVTKKASRSSTVHGLQPGQAIIKAEGEGKSDSASVTVAAQGAGQEP